jgi:hypothetical protein
MDEKTYFYESVTKHNAETRRRQLYQRLLLWYSQKEETSSHQTQNEEAQNVQQNSNVRASVQ